MKVGAGIYHGKLKDVDIGAGGNKKTPRLRLIFAVDHKLSTAGEWEPVDETFRRSVDLFLTDKALQWSEERLAFLGFDGNYLEPTIQGFDSELSEVGCDLTCEIKKDGERSYESWSINKLEDIRSGGLDPLAGKDIDRLAARYKQSQAITKTPSGAPGAPESVGVGASSAPGPSTPEKPPASE